MVNGSCSCSSAKHLTCQTTNCANSIDCLLASNRMESMCMQLAVAAVRCKAMAIQLQF